uniref:Uncharacterized protein n=1 Tax=Hucho hucho TaxID=62062 RepID=A0A4W5S0I4_9TELE
NVYISYITHLIYIYVYILFSIPSTASCLCRSAIWNPWEDEQADDLSALLKRREAFRQRAHQPHQHTVTEQWREGEIQVDAVNRLAVVLLGIKRCTKDWISIYLRRHGGFLDLLFLVYECPLLNDKDVFQWPLGVATYRQFPVVMANSQMVSSTSPFLCNFLGTVYKNS